MKKVIFSLVAFVLAGSIAEAALPPKAESLRHFAAIAQSSDVYQRLGDVTEIKAINGIGNNKYEVMTEGCVLPVTIEYKVSDPVLIGPGQIEVVVGNAICLP